MISKKMRAKMGVSDFLRWFFTVDLKDWTNYLALLVAIFLFWWGIKTIIISLTTPLN